MTINQAVYTVKDGLIEQDQDSRLRDRFIWSKIWSAAKLLIHRELKNKDFSKLNIFETFYLDTEEVNMLENSCVPDACFKCRAKVPKVLETEDGPVYKFIGTPDFSIRFIPTSVHSSKVKSKIKGNKEVYVYQEGNYLYLTECFPCIVVLAIPDNESPTGCNIRDSKAPIPGHLEEVVFRMAIETISPFLQKQYDHISNKNTNQ